MVFRIVLKVGLVGSVVDDVGVSRLAMGRLNAARVLVSKVAFCLPLTPERRSCRMIFFDVAESSAGHTAEMLFSVALSHSSRDARLRRGRDDDARVVCAGEAGAPRRELLVVALLLDVQQHAEQAHDAHAGHQAGRGEALLQRVDGDGRPRVDAEAAVGVGCHCNAYVIVVGVVELERLNKCGSFVGRWRVGLWFRYYVYRIQVLYGSYEGSALAGTRRHLGGHLSVYTSLDHFFRVLAMGRQIVWVRSTFATRWSSIIVGSHDAPTRLPLAATRPISSSVVDDGRTGQRTKSR